MPLYCKVSIFNLLSTASLGLFSFFTYTNLNAANLNADEIAEIIIIPDLETDAVESNPQTVDTIDSSNPHFSSSTRLEEFSDYIPGVFTGRAQAGIYSDVEIRGFSIGGRVYKDGILDNQKLYLRDPDTIDKVEFTKGHDSVLFGAGSPGGSVNYITKKPQADAINRLKISAGSPELLRVSHDIGGALNSDKSLLGRMISVVQQAKTGIDHVDDNRLTLMPAITWNTPDTKIGLSAEYSQRERPFDFDHVIRNGEPVYNVDYVDPRNESKRHNRFLNLEIKHRLSSQIEASLAASKISVDRKEKLVGYYYKLNEDDLLGYYREVDNDYSQFSFKSELSGIFPVGSFTHEPTLGIEKNEQDGLTDSRRSIGAFTLDILNPSFDFPLPSGDQLIENDYRTLLKDKSVYALDRLTISDTFFLKAGVRKSWFSESIIKTDATTPQSDSDAVSSSFGASWVPNDQVALYVNRSTSFTPNSPDRKQNLFPPKKGVQVEAGLRYLSKDKSWRINSALYKITQSNLAVRDPDDRDLKILSGEQQVKGFELSSSKNLGYGTKLQLGYSYMDSVINKDTTGLEGNELNNVPKHSGSLNLSKKVESGFARNTHLDLGLVAVGKRQGDRRNSFQIDGFTRIDLNVSYPLSKQTSLNLSVKNLFDKDYIAASYAEDLLVIGNTRKTLLSITHDL